MGVWGISRLAATIDQFVELCYSSLCMGEDNVVDLGRGGHDGSGLDDGDSGCSEAEGDPYVDMWLPKINPDVIAQIFVVRRNLILNDPVTPTERAVATDGLSRVLQLLSFADAQKIERSPSFYVRLLNRLIELRPDLCGIVDRLKKRADELERRETDVKSMIGMLRGAISGLVGEQAARGVLGEK